MSTLATSAIDAGHLDSYNRNASESSRRLTLQDLLQTEPVQRSESRYASPVGCSRTPSPTEPTSSTMMHYNNCHTSPPLGSHHINRYTPPQLPPISKQQQCLRVSPLYKPQNPAMNSTMNSAMNSAMDVDSYKITLPTPLTSPNPGPTMPRVQSLHSYPSTPSSPTPITPLQLDDQSSYMKTIQTSGTTPLSLSERRERNKVASAKYRAKKHKQNQEMSSQINELIAENNVLTRQLEEIRAENNELKELVDKLKSKLVEGKILKRLGRGGAKLAAAAAVTNTIGTTDGLTTLTTVKKGTRRNGYSGHAKGTEATPKNSRK
ncbi:10811_t:CDS:1 [Dentiscutata heterogama]|uniref:10811_t:CDS:1 n=1 Tax=Dentiscutata heterogama TaxID=1316150 RepID=A0ACA9JVY3_9GLOM|nr:10811_t:CDS:1 [Dentiscutata heterogama]